jgi:hypothetical protein
MINLLKNKTKVKNLKFEKENDGKWYIVLPEWEGAHNELEMVAGADMLLDNLSADGKYCDINVSEDFVENSIELILDRHAGGGGVYNVFYPNTQPKIVPQIWLCHVTKFVYGGVLPEKLYFSINN